MKKVKYTLLLLASMIFFDSALASYNEVFDEQGQLRPAYRAFFERTGVDPLKIDPQFGQAMTIFPVGDKVKIYPMPFVLSEEDAQTLARGAEQRARAYRELFYDLFIGNQRVFKSRRKAFKGIFTKDFVKGVMADEWDIYTMEKMRELWAGRKLEDIQFMYGPDLMRGADGQFYVIEDNIGYLGGLIDSHAIEQSFFSSHPEYSSEEAETVAYFQSMVQAYLEAARIDVAKATGALFHKDWVSKEEGGVVELTESERERYAWGLRNGWLYEDQEVNRLADVFRRLGVPIVTDISKEASEEENKAFRAALDSGHIKFLFQRTYSDT